MSSNTHTVADLHSVHSMPSTAATAAAASAAAVHHLTMDIDAPAGVYILIHDPHDTFGAPFSTLEGARFCLGASLDPPCDGFTPTMQQYFDRFMQLKQQHGFIFDVNVIHWDEGNDILRGRRRHSLLIGPNYSHTRDGDRPELFKAQWDEVKLELGIQGPQVHPHLRFKEDDKKKKKKGPAI